MEIIDRIKEPMPVFWKKVQRIGIALGTIGGAIVASPVILPTIVATIGGYLATIGVVTSALAQMTSTER